MLKHRFKTSSRKYTFCFATEWCHCVSIPQVVSKEPKCTRVYTRKKYKGAIVGDSRRSEALHQNEGMHGIENLDLSLGPIAA